MRCERRRAAPSNRWVGALKIVTTRATRRGSCEGSGGSVTIQIHASTRAERWPSGRRHQIANSVQAVLPDQLTPWNPCKSRVFNLPIFLPDHLKRDHVGHFWTLWEFGKFSNPVDLLGLPARSALRRQDRRRLALSLRPSRAIMLRWLRMSGRFRAVFCSLLAACIFFGPAVVPGHVLCVEASGFVEIEPSNAPCCGTHFNQKQGSGVHACGDCSDSLMSAGLHRSTSPPLFRAFPGAAFSVPISFRQASTVAFGFPERPPQQVRPPGIVLLC